MKAKFSCAVNRSCRAMRNIPTDEMKRYLRRGGYSCSQIDVCESTDVILDFISSKCSIIDVNILEGVADFFDIDDAQVNLAQYKENIDKFCESLKLHDSLNQQFASCSLLTCEELTIVVDKSVDDYFLEDVRMLINLAFKEYSQHVKLVVIKENNSFTIVCSFPLTLSESLISTALKNLKILEEKGVIKLTIGYCTIIHDEVC